MKKYIFVDLDGTLLNSKGVISNNTKSALKRAKEAGYEIILCTGRSLQYSFLYQQECDVSPWLILCNGAQIYNCKKKQFLYQTGIPTETVDKFYRLSQILNLDISYTIRDDNYSNTLEEGNILITEENYQSMKQQLIVRCALSSSNFSNMLKAKQEILRWGSVSIVNETEDIIHQKPFPFRKKSFLEISNFGTSKGNCILKLLSMQEKPGYVYTIGNSINDRSMFDVADFSIAMENADIETKKGANWITKSNDEEGVAIAIDWIIANGGKNSKLLWIN